MSGDDELGRFLRGEVPEPGPGYWEEIEARLQGVEAERDAADLGITATPLEAILPDYLWRFRPSGQYDAIKDSAGNLKA